MRIPTATYRLQFGGEMDLARARSIVPYLDSLGVSDVYASPLLAARPESGGYHVIDPTSLDPALGGRDAFESFAGALRERDMGLIMDVVPNHMAASYENPWWTDMLRCGRESEYAPFFDVDWERLGGKLLVPALDAPLEEVLDRGGLTVRVEGGEPMIRYHEQVFPIDPRTIGGAEAVGELLERQAYVLAHWRDAAAEINYRRFFDISDLVAIRQEDPAVFDATHALVLELVRGGLVTGLRIDHVDGLRDPLGYLERLREAVGADVPIWVEKILGPGEDLAAEWPVQGTTGYEFASAANDALLDREGVEKVRAVAAELTGRDEPFSGVAAARKRQVMQELFSGQVRRLVEDLRPVLGGKAPPEPALTEALVEVTARLPVYRTYIREKPVASRDRRVIERAVADARPHVEDGARSALEQIREVLLLRRGAKRGLDFVLRWQQLAGPVMAKGVEDTALYDDPALVSRDDVGFHPGEPAEGVQGFHRFLRDRANRRPNALSATSTHDSKRSEDVRARIDVLAEAPERWRRALGKWTKVSSQLKQTVDGDPVPDPTEELVLYQTLLGLEPLGDGRPGPLAYRIEEFARKAARERKVHTSWTDPDEKHEDALVSFIRLLFDGDGRALREDISAFGRGIAAAGATNALAQTLLKLAAPGVPDLYQGTERWFLALVDPDNRRPVDFEDAGRALESLAHASASTLVKTWSDGRVKLHLVRTALALRRSDPALFARGSCVPLEASGEHAGHVLAFARRLRGRWAIAAVPRLVSAIGPSGSFPTGPEVWSDTSLALPKGAPTSWRDLLTDKDVEAKGDSLALGELFGTFPVALLVPGR